MLLILAINYCYYTATGTTTTTTTTTTTAAAATTAATTASATDILYSLLGKRLIWSCKEGFQLTPSIASIHLSSQKRYVFDML